MEFKKSQKKKIMVCELWPSSDESHGNKHKYVIRKKSTIRFVVKTRSKQKEGSIYFKIN